MTDLQSMVINERARNKVLSLIGNLYSLQQQILKGNDDLTFLITNIQNLLKGISRIVNFEPLNTTTTITDTKSANTHISLIQILLEELQSNTRDVNQLLQELLAELQNLKENVAIPDARNVIVSMIQSLYLMLQSNSQATSDYQFFIKNIRDGVQQVSSIINGATMPEMSTGTDVGSNAPGTIDVLPIDSTNKVNSTRSPAVIIEIRKID